MDITKTKSDQFLELKLRGRLDAYWADHVSAAIEESIRQGSHHIRLNLADVDYLSSAGIRVLIKFFKQLGAIKGSLRVVNPSPNAFSILELAGLGNMVVTNELESTGADLAAENRSFSREHGDFKVFDLNPGASLQCLIVGDPAKLEHGGYTAADSHSQAYPESTFGFGLGAFGSGFEECRERFGEFLALGGAAAYLPTDGTNVPDYVVSEGLLVPELEVLYGVSGRGSFSKLVRFEAKPEPPGVLPLAELVEGAFEAAQADVIAIALIAESAGLVGAALKRSVAAGKLETSPLSFPAARDWLSFTTERGHERTLSAVVGVAARAPSAELGRLLRPIGTGTRAFGHFHAAVFPYRPLQKGELNLHKTVNALFSTESMIGLLHLLADDREIDGIGQSEFWRGACWTGPVSEIKTAS